MAIVITYIWVYIHRCPSHSADLIEIDFHLDTSLLKRNTHTHALLVNLNSYIQLAGHSLKQHVRTTMTIFKTTLAKLVTPASHDT